MPPPIRTPRRWIVPTTINNSSMRQPAHGCSSRTTLVTFVCCMAHGVSHRHGGILIMEQLPPPRHSEIAHAIDAFSRSPSITFDNMLFEWTHRANWQPFRP